MILEVQYEDEFHRIEVDPETLEHGAEFFDRMDRDMDAGWRMGIEFVEQPDQMDRGRIAASRLVSAIATGNRSMIQAMAGYILARIPGAVRVEIDTTGEMRNTRILTR